jgi:preprotein translocase subunit SecG
VLETRRAFRLILCWKRLQFRFPDPACYTVGVVIAVLLTIVHVVVCFFLIIVILLQSGKAADLAGAFGGMGSQTAFGPRGSATLLSKATTISTVVFMLTSISLSIIATKNNGSSSGTVLERHPTKTSSAPAVPAPPAPKK